MAVSETEKALPAVWVAGVGIANALIAAGLTVKALVAPLLLEATSVAVSVVEAAL